MQELVHEAKWPHELLEVHRVEGAVSQACPKALGDLAHIVRLAQHRVAIFIPAEGSTQRPHNLVLLECAIPVPIPILKPLARIPVNARDAVPTRRRSRPQLLYVTHDPILEAFPRHDKLRQSDGPISIRVPLVPVRSDVLLQLVPIHRHHGAKSFDNLVRVQLSAKVHVADSEPISWILCQIWHILHLRKRHPTKRASGGATGTLHGPEKIVGAVPVEVVATTTTRVKSNDTGGELAELKVTHWALEGLRGHSLRLKLFCNDIWPEPSGVLVFRLQHIHREASLVIDPMPWSRNCNHGV